MDPVTLTLAILPLCLTAVKAAGKAKAKFESFKDYMNIIEQMRARFQIQLVFFNVEIESFLLQATKGYPASSKGVSAILRDLLENPSISSRAAQSLEPYLRDYLGNASQAFSTILRNIEQHTKRIDANLSLFDEPDSSGREGGTPAHRIKNRTVVTMLEKKFKEDIEKLVTSLEDFQRLRVACHKRSSHGLNKTSDEELSYIDASELTLGPYRGRVQQGSQEAEYPDQPLSDIGFGSVSTTLDFMALNSRSAASNNIYASSDRQLDVLLESRRLARSLYESLVTSSDFVGPTFRNEGHIARMFLWSHSPESHMFDFVIENGESIMHGHSRHNPANNGIIFACSKYTARSKTSFNKQAPGVYSARGHVEQSNWSTENGTRMFFLVPPSEPIYNPSKIPDLQFGYAITAGHDIHGVIQSSPKGEPLAFSEIFSRPVEDSLSDLQMLKLAVTLIKSLLRFQNTGWWGQAWYLEDLQLYQDPEAEFDLFRDLSTLHTKRYIPREFSGGAGSDMAPGISSGSAGKHGIPNDVLEAMKEHGIRNLSLWGIGVALLQIALWERVRWEDDVDVRKKSSALRYMGQDYRTITEQLLNCDFGVGHADLGREDLQRRICEMIPRIERFIRRLES